MKRLDYHVRWLLLCCSAALLVILTSCQLVQVHKPGEKTFCRKRKIFEAGMNGRRCHSSTITELANGDLIAAWWSGSYEGATDVVIKAARFHRGEGSWEPAVTVADIPDKFDGNPVLFAVPDGRVWLLFVTVEKGTSSTIQIMFRDSNDLGHTWSPVKEFPTQSGIRTRNHPIILSNGEILLPLHNHVLGQSVFLISGDLGRTWELSAPIISDPGNVQPTAIPRDNGDLYVLMRTWHEDPVKRFLWQSESHDYGRTWSPPTYSSVPTVSSAIEMVRLHNGHVLLAFNNGRGRERTPLSLALSVDGGRTWPFVRDVESGEGSYSYPSLVQSRDGHIHVTYSYNREYIKHVEVNEAWIQAIR